MYEIVDDFSWKLAKVVRLIEKLAQAGLITRVNFGGYKPNRYYIHNLTEDKSE